MNKCEFRNLGGGHVGCAYLPNPLCYINITLAISHFLLVGIKRVYGQMLNAFTLRYLPPRAGRENWYKFSLSKGAGVAPLQRHYFKRTCSLAVFMVLLTYCLINFKLLNPRNGKIQFPKKKVSPNDKTYKYTFTPHIL